MDNDKKWTFEMDKDEGWKIIVIELMIVAIGYVLLALFTTPLYLFGGVADPTTGIITGGVDINWERLWLIAGVVYTIASIRVWKPVGPDEIGVRIALGKPIGSVTSGPPVSPPGVVEIEVYPATTPQREFPTEPEKFFRVIEGQPDVVPDGMRPPLRILFGESLPEADVLRVLGDPASGGYAWVWRPGTAPDTEKGEAGLESNKIFFNPIVGDNGLARGQLTAEVAHISRIRITDAVALTKNVPKHDVTGNRTDEVFRQIEDEQVIVINNIYPKISVAQAQLNMEWMNAILFMAVERRIKAVNGHSDEWGIDLEGAAIKVISFSRATNTAISNATNSVYALTTTINQAKGIEETLTREGAGKASAARDLEEQRLIGRGKGLAAAASATGLTPADLLGAEVAGTVGAGDGTIIIGADGVGQLAGIAAAFAPKPAKNPKP